jgi:hypothetical protein
MQQPTASPFSVAGVPLEQGTAYEPGPVQLGDTMSIDQDVDEVLNEDEEEKTPLNKKMILFICCGAFLLVLFIILIVAIANNSSAGDGSTEETFAYETDDLPVTEEDDIQWVTPDYGDTSTTESQAPVVDNSYHLPAEDIEKLRAAGYTANEIEQFEADKVDDIAPLLKKAATDKQRFLLEQYQFLQERMASGIDEETSYIFNNSIFSLPGQEMTEAELDSWGLPVPALRSTFRENVNYTKLPLMGSQCLLKLSLEDGTILFFYVSPERYAELTQDEGNIVIKYTVIEWRGCRFIGNIEELPI